MKARKMSQRQLEKREQRLREALAYLYQKDFMSTLPVIGGPTGEERAEDMLLEGVMGYREQLVEHVWLFTMHIARFHGYPEPDILAYAVHAAMCVALRIPPADIEAVLQGAPDDEEKDEGCPGVEDGETCPWCGLIEREFGS